MADYIYIGSSIDSPDTPMDPLEDHPLVLDIKPKPKLELSGHPLQIRIDNIPRDQLEIRDMYAVEVSPRNIPSNVNTGGGGIAH